MKMFLRKMKRGDQVTSPESEPGVLKVENIRTYFRLSEVVEAKDSF